jgi:ABC-type nitrate/sulfonate/bicarbonate transport system substrate-binding protein
MAGIFKKKGLNLEILFTAGSGETLQAVISGAVDIGVAVATSSAMGAIVAGPGIPAALAARTGLLRAGRSCCPGKLSWARQGPFLVRPR